MVLREAAQFAIFRTVQILNLLSLNFSPSRFAEYWTFPAAAAPSRRRCARHRLPDWLGRPAWLIHLPELHYPAAGESGLPDDS